MTPLWTSHISFSKNLFVIVAMTLILFGSHIDANAQLSEIFETNSIVRSLKKRFDLKTADTLKIKQRIDLEARDLIQLFSRHIDTDRPEYSDEIWDDLIRRRRALEMRRDATNRQRVALREARSEMERRLTMELAGRFLNRLYEVLDLVDWQVDEIRDILARECDEMLIAINYLVPLPTVLEQRVGSIRRKNIEAIRKLLSDSQWREYIRLTVVSEQIG